MTNKAIGYIDSGSLRRGLSVVLYVPTSDIHEGAFVTIDDERFRYYGLVTDVATGRINNTADVIPVLSRISSERSEQCCPVRRAGTIPPHHAEVRMAAADDIADIFGRDEKGFFVIGYTREQGHPVRIDLDKFVQRSAGIFGATGTGKSFLTRIILAGMLHHNAASVLVFDMHNEYGYDDTASDTNETVTGLKTKFPTRVQVVGLGSGAMIRSTPPDFNLEIAMSDILPEDIELLARTLNLRETTATTLDALYKRFGKNWFREFKAMKNGAVTENEDGKKNPAPDSVAYWANEAGVNVMAAEGLRNKMNRVFGLPYIVEHPAADTISLIVDSLRSGKSIVLSFGEHERDLDYLLVTNLLTRRIRKEWENQVNAFRSSGTGEPRPLVIVLEEAHKLLNREMAAQTTFSTIAREMRKYYVTLLIIDQRPAQIYDEVMSQLGTRISGKLGDDDDIRAVLSGLAGRDALRGMLSRLQPKEEVLLLGWGVPMPLPVRSRRYDARFWEELLGEQDGGAVDPDEILRDLGCR